LTVLALALFVKFIMAPLVVATPFVKRKIELFIVVDDVAFEVFAISINALTLALLLLQRLRT
jgi:hypothetical protein